ncbi:Translation factor pelota [Coniochaeta pulveracea]|uniref:Protein DOM34 homolog n=1 Tax=Coniochaeta pulveracea TaxID=177199 RepID=A0A420YGQ3_9PEZI|nr:Translation factor pelota [Coniochaeta pulveracea]
MKLSRTKGVAELLAHGGTDEDVVTLTPEEPEDMWHANNLIAVDDILRAHAIRKVTRTTNTGSTTSDRVHTTLTIRVESTFFDPVASALHVSGPVVEENENVSTGQYHTLDLELNRQFTLLKPGGWDSVAKETLAEALRPESGDDLAAVVMQEGLANICVVTEFRTVLKQRVEHSIPKKRAGSSALDNGTKAFYEKVMNTLLRAVDFEPKDGNGSRALLLASPGFVATEFRKYMQEQAQRTNDKKLMAIARDAMVVHSSSGHIHALNEILKSPEVQSRMKDTKYGSETKMMDDFFKRLRNDDGRAWYGVKPVEKAVNEGAVGSGGGVLMVNNSLFRNMDVATRKRYVGLVDKVKAAGGDARVLSSDHESGQRLDALGGIAAVLTYPIFDLDESDDEEAGGDEGQNGEGMAI